MASNRVVEVNFEGVEAGAMFVRVPEGDYGLKITKADIKKGSESGKNYINLTFKLTKGAKGGVGKSLPHSCSLQKQSLWNLRNLLEACGKEVPSKAVKINLDKMIGWECAGTAVDDEYEGKKKSVISAFFPLADLGNTSKDGGGLEASGDEEAEETEKEETDDTEELFS